MTKLLHVSHYEGENWMKIVVSDQKTAKAYMASTEQALFVGKKLGEIIKLDEIGLPGYEAKITGGSDKDGFPMRKDLDGNRRVKLLLSKSVGFRPVEQGERRKKRVRGNTINEDTVQINTKVIKPEKYENPEEKKAEEAPKEAKS